MGNSEFGAQFGTLNPAVAASKRLEVHINVGLLCVNTVASVKSL